MTKQEIDTYATKLIEERIKASSEKMATFNNLRQVFEELTKSGFEEGAKAFKNLVFSMLLIDINTSEEEILKELYQNMRK